MTQYTLPCRRRVVQADSSIWDNPVFRKNKYYFCVDEEQGVAVLTFDAEPTEPQQTLIRILLANYVL